MSERDDLLVRIKKSFPAEPWSGRAAPHECPQCSALSLQLDGRAWTDLDGAELDELDVLLPLLSPEAFRSLVPAWLHHAVMDPDRPAAGYLIVHLEGGEHAPGLSRAQRDVVRAVVRFVLANNIWGDDDEGNRRALAAVESLW